MSRVDHIAAVVQDLDAANKLLVNAFGFRTGSVGENQALGIRFAFLEGENIKIELIEPVAEGPYREVLENGGAGLNHIAISVDNLGATMNRLEKDGVKPSEKPIVAARGTIVNLDPTTTNGIRIQLFKSKRHS